MTTRHYVDAQGNYIGGFGDGATPPPGATEVRGRPPASALERRVGGRWVTDTTGDLNRERNQMVVSRFQAKAALLAAGRLADVEAAIAKESPVRQLAWKEAIEFRRNSPTIEALRQVMHLSPEDVDELFRQAAAIEV